MHYPTSSYTPSTSNYSSKITDDGLSVTVLHIISKQDNLKFSTEELRYNQMRNRFGSYQNFAHDHSTPPRYPLPSSSYSSALTRDVPMGSNMSTGYNSGGFTNSTALNNRSNLSGYTTGYSAGLSTGSSSAYGTSAYRNPANPFSTSSTTAASAGYSGFNSSSVSGTNNYLNSAGFNSQNTGAGQFQSNSGFNANSGFQNNPFRTGGYGQPSTTSSNPFSANGQGNPFAQPAGNTGNPFAGNSNFNSSSYGNNTSGVNPFGNGNVSGNVNASNGFSSVNQGNPFSQPSNFNQMSSANPFSTMPQFTNSNQVNLNQPYSNPFSNNQSTGFTSSTSSLSQPNFFVNSSRPSTTPFFSNPSFSNQTNPAQSSSFFTNPSTSLNYPSSTSQIWPQSSGGLYSQNLSTQYNVPSFSNTPYPTNPNPLVSSSNTRDHRVLKNPFKDPHGLTYIFPDEDPELVAEFKIQPFVSTTSENTSRRQKEPPIPMGSKQQDDFTIFEPEDTLSRFRRTEKIFFFKQEQQKKEKKFKFKRDFKAIEENIKPNLVETSDVEIIFYVNVVDVDIKEKVSINAYLSSNLAEIKEKVLKLIQSNKQFNFKYNGKMLTGFETVKDIGIAPKSELVLESVVEEYPSENQLPVTRLLKVTPSIEQMKRMKLKELKNIENLTLENEYGKIMFECPINVIGINFDQFISFSHKEFISFPNGENSSDERLNKPALVTLFRFNPRKNPGKVEISLRIKCENNGTEFIKYDPDSQEFTFRIQNL